MYGRRAQSGETITWVVATLIIVFILAVSIYAGFLLGKTRGNLPFVSDTKDVDLVVEKSMFAYLLSGQDNQAEILVAIENSETPLNIGSKLAELRGVLG